jgi:NAD(P)-dependent dehydrogenase (short-subunit alcohol dehydrogenase family)
MLDSKVIVVTGGAGLIGKECIKAISDNNGIAVIADINIELAKEASLQINKVKGFKKVDYVSLDITSSESLENCIEKLHLKYGRIDALVNNAYPKNPNFGNDVFDIKYEDFCENVNMNLGGYFLTTQIFSKYFRKQGYGNIINMSSIYGVIAPRFDIYQNTNITNEIEYAVIKAGLIHMTKYLSKYFKGMNIRVNTISPGGILDNQPKVFLDSYNKYCLSKGMLNKEDLNGTLIYLLSEMSKYVNGQNIVVDDGFSL